MDIAERNETYLPVFIEKKTILYNVWVFKAYHFLLDKYCAKQFNI